MKLHKRLQTLFAWFFLSSTFFGVYGYHKAIATTSTVATSESSPSDTVEQSPEEIAKQQLEFEIRKKNAELEAIKTAIKKNEDALAQTGSQKASLQKELTTLQRQQAVLTSQIKKDQVNLEKLGLEIKSLTYNIQDIQEEIINKRRGVEELIRLMQRSENIDMLTVILRSNSLSEAAGEVKNLIDLNARLTTDIQDLRKLNVQYGGKLKDLNIKQAEVTSEAFNLKNRKVILTNQEAQRQTLLKETKNQEAIYQEHLKQVYAQQELIAAEIEALDAKLRGEIDYAKLPTVGKILILPIAKGRITQGYGNTSFAKSTYRGKWHNGLDIGGSVGTPVMAAADGQVVATGDQDRYCPRGAYGKFIVVKHNNNLTTLYAHLSRVVMSVGDPVKQGQTIAYSGATGWATGPHLHFTVFAQQTFKMGGSKTCGPMPQGGDLSPLKYL